jgi:hypothetical protein
MSRSFSISCSLNLPVLSAISGVAIILITRSLNKGQFLISDFLDVFYDTGSKISELYLSIPSTEVWNIDCINTTIRQIDFYRETKIFRSAQDILTFITAWRSCLITLKNKQNTDINFPIKNEIRTIQFLILYM